jgi:hypothetical protein
LQTPPQGRLGPPTLRVLRLWWMLAKRRNERGRRGGYPLELFRSTFRPWP